MIMSSVDSTLENSSQANSIDMEVESSIQLIKVEIYNDTTSSSILKVLPDTTTKMVCESMANKLDIPPEQTKYFNLVLMISWQIVTYKDQSASNLSNIASSKASRIFNRDVSSIPSRTYVRTLRSTECVQAVYQKILSKQIEKYNSLSFNASRSLDDFNVKWIYKDMRAIPLSCNEKYCAEDISCNNSSSDEEEDISIHDLQYINQFERRGYMLRRSKRDPNIWRKRYCILSDNLWCINTHNLVDKFFEDTSVTTLTSTMEKLMQQSFTVTNSITRNRRVKGLQIPIGGRQFRIFDRVQGFEYPHCIALQLPNKGSSQNIVFLRTMNASDKSLWLSELQKKAIINFDSESIHMADLILSDEVKVQANKLVKEIVNPIEKIFLIPESQECPISSINPDVSLFEDLNSSNVSSTSPIKPFSTESSFVSSSNIKSNHGNDVKQEVSSFDVSSSLIISSEPISPSKVAFNLNRLKYQNNSSRNVKLPYSVDTQDTISLQIHSLLNYSILHSFHISHPNLASMITFLADVSRYKQLYRVEIVPNCRKLWIAILTIYHKHILPQIAIINEDIEVNGHTSFASIKSWMISNDTFTELNGQIFANIRRFKAGFEIESYLENDFEIDEFGELIDNGEKDSGVSTETGSSTMQPSSTYWFWGSNGSSVSSPTSASSSTNIKATKSKVVDPLQRDKKLSQFITISQLSGPYAGYHVNPLANKTNSATKQNERTSSSSQSSEGLYQIVDISILPSIHILDSIAAQVLLSIETSCKDSLQNQSYQRYNSGASRTPASSPSKKDIIYSNNVDDTYHNIGDLLDAVTIQ